MLVLVGLGVVVAYLVLRATILAPVDTHGASVHRFGIDSKAAGRSLDVGVVVPGGDGPGHRPLLVFLHGKGETVDSFVGDGWFSGDVPFFAALAKLGPGAPVVAFPEDDGDSYWHDRATGDWGTYVMDEAIPEVERRYGTNPQRVAIGGISMGGFGAYSLALEHPGASARWAATPPALWLEGGASAPGAFDDAEDFERHVPANTSAPTGIATGTRICTSTRARCGTAADGAGPRPRSST